jgi:hypothetical protein
MWIFEFLALIIEVVGYTTILLAVILGVLSKAFFLQFLLFGYAFATLISIGAVLLEEMAFRRYSDWREIARLLNLLSLRAFSIPPPYDGLASPRHLAVSSRRAAVAINEKSRNLHNQLA